MPPSPRPPSARSALSLVVALLVTLPLAPRTAAAADRRPVELPLTSGRSVEGVVESADALEVVVRVGPEEVRRIPWNRLLPLGLFRVKAALAPPADGEARLELGELAVELGLFVEARIEFEKALALGALDRPSFQKIVSQAERDAVEVGVRQALRAADAGEHEVALEMARNLKLHFAGAANAGAVDRLVADLLSRVATLQEETAEAAEELEQVRLEVERNKEILKRHTRAVGRVDLGRREAAKATEAMGRGNLTRAEKHTEAADAAFMNARRDLGRLRRILRPEQETYREVLVLLGELDRLQFDLLLAAAWFFWDQTVYSKADRFAARASYVDPVHPDLLDLRDQLRSVRIRYRLSDVTNARPIVR